MYGNNGFFVFDFIFVVVIRLNIIEENWNVDRTLILDVEKFSKNFGNWWAIYIGIWNFRVFIRFNANTANFTQGSPWVVFNGKKDKCWA